MDEVTYKSIRESLRRLYLEDERSWLVGFSGDKDNTKAEHETYNGLYCHLALPCVSVSNN